MRVITCHVEPYSWGLAFEGGAPDRIVLISSGSERGAAEMARRLYPQAEVITTASPLHPLHILPPEETVHMTSADVQAYWRKVYEMQIETVYNEESDRWGITINGRPHPELVVMSCATEWEAASLARGLYPRAESLITTADLSHPLHAKTVQDAADFWDRIKAVPIPINVDPHWPFMYTVPQGTAERKPPGSVAVALTEMHEKEVEASKEEKEIAILAAKLAALQVPKAPGMSLKGRLGGGKPTEAVVAAPTAPVTPPAAPPVAAPAPAAAPTPAAAPAASLSLKERLALKGLK